MTQVIDTSLGHMIDTSLEHMIDTSMGHVINTFPKYGGSTHESPL